MKTRKGLLKSQTVLGIVAAGALVCGLTLHGATPRNGVSGPLEDVVKLLEQGHPVPVEMVRWAAPTVGRSSRSMTITTRQGRNLIAGSGWEPSAGMVAARTGGPTGCELDDECDSCNECAKDTCNDQGVCTEPPEDACEPCNDGLFCNGIERCDGAGLCVAAEEVMEKMCKGGPRDTDTCHDVGTSSECQECVDGSRDGQTCCPENGRCTANVCVDGSRNGLDCCPDSGTCDITGNCDLQALPVDPCALSPLLCNELEPVGTNRTGACTEACDTDDDCQNTSGCDGVEVCVKMSDILGPGHGGECTCDQWPCATATGTPCDDATDCSGDDFCGGVCRPDPAGPVCGIGSVFREPCDSPIDDCGNTGSAVGAASHRFGGRCCVPDGNDFFCCRASRPVCVGTDAVPGTGCEAENGAPSGPGKWLGVGDKPTLRLDEAGCESPQNFDTTSGESYVCPKYAAGITEGNLVDVFGPASVADCRPFWEIGDDYRMQNCDTPDTSWYTVKTVRGFFGFDDGTGSRMKISFYTTAGIFIEDVITDGSSVSGIAFRTVPFEENPVIPCEGIITLKPWAESNPGSRQRWATTDACPGGVCEAGTNNLDVVYTRLTEGGLLTAVTPASVGLISGVLALEIVGEKREEPTGACCDTATGFCTEVLPWVCDSLDNFFQGVGTSCRVCSNTLDTGCSGDEECRACEGGENPGQACTSDDDCTGGVEPRTCTGFAECTLVPPACETEACCINNPKDPTSTCIDRPACLVFGEETGRPCLSPQQIDDCEAITGGVCTSDCPVGTTPRGVGTDCEPNCCQQTYSGADTCAEADIVMIHVPSLDDGEVTYTFTGNNKLATFGDYVPLDENGPGTCQFAMFNEDGGTRDRGWWHAFSIDDCANVRIDLCCTEVNSGTPHEPQWSGLWTECNPCGDVIGSTIVGEPVGLPDVSVNRGEPFCSGGDDLWRTFGPLPKGIYWEPIYSAPGGHFGEYQYHVVVSACPVAACCLPTAACIGGPTPGGACVNNLDCCDVVEEGQCQDPAPGTCVEDCAVLRQGDCEDAGGFWQGLNNLPLDIAPVITCGSNNSNCGLGSCCTGPGQCVDRASDQIPCDPLTPSTCMDLKGCATLDGTFVGGGRCDFPLLPCPACEIVGEGNCQGFDGRNAVILSDLAVKPGGVTNADDFIPVTNKISRICVWGIYLDHSVITEPTQQCTGKVEDNFRVRIYLDNNGTPGDLVPDGERWISEHTIPKVAKSESAADSLFGADYPLTAYTLAFPEITLPAAGGGEIYWIEVANNTTVLTGGLEDKENTCYWHWAQTHLDDAIGNLHSAQGTDDRPCAGDLVPPVYPDGERCVEPRISGYDDVYSARAKDLVFCLGDANGPVSFVPPTTPKGTVCDCSEPPVCGGPEALGDIVGADTGESSAVWGGPNTTCGTCADPGQVGDQCGAPALGSVASLDCTPDVLLSGAYIEVTGNSVLIPIDTSCTNTDGPLLVDSDFGEAQPLGFDVWVCYTSSCTGKLTGSMCATGLGNGQGGFDAFMGVYHNPLSPNECPCPGSSAGGQFGRGADESCNGIANSGPGIFRGPIVFPGQKWLFRVGGWGPSVNEAERGRGFLDIGCEATLCEPASAPVAEVLDTGGGTTAGTPKVNIKNRLISITTAQAGRAQKIRVRLANLPAPYDIWNDTDFFVGQPREACENSGKDLTTAPKDCPSALPTDRFWVAPLVCSIDDAAEMDWRGSCVSLFCDGGLKDGTLSTACAEPPCPAAPCVTDDDCVEYVHLYHEGLVPSKMLTAGGPIEIPAEYHIQVLDGSCPNLDDVLETKTCASGSNEGGSCDDDGECPDGKCLPTPVWYSRALVMEQSGWGDICGPGSGGACSAVSDEVVDVANDVLGVLDKFANLNPLQKARADIEGRDVDFKVNVANDVLFTLAAFGGAPYPFGPSVGDPCAASLSMVRGVEQREVQHEGSK